MAYNEAKKISNQKSDAKYSQILLKPYKEEAASNNQLQLSFSVLPYRVFIV